MKKILDDDEVPTDVLHSAARVIYDICVKSLPEDDYVEDHVRRSLDATAKWVYWACCNSLENPNAKFLSCRKQLKQAFSTFRETQFEYTRGIVRQLHSWRESRIANNPGLAQQTSQSQTANALDPQIFTSSEYSWTDLSTSGELEDLSEFDSLLHSLQVSSIKFASGSWLLTTLSSDCRKYGF